MAGPKKNYKFRLEAPERGAEAGMRSISIGALLGLADFRKDAFFTAMHGKYLRDKYPHIDISYSVPRIRPCEGGLKKLNEVDDRELVQILLAYRLFDLQGGINELNFKEVLGAGADDFACMSLLFISNNIKKSLDTFKAI